MCKDRGQLAPSSATLSSVPSAGPILGLPSPVPLVSGLRARHPCRPLFCLASWLGEGGMVTPVPVTPSQPETEVLSVQRRVRLFCVALVYADFVGDGAVFTLERKAIISHCSVL